MKIVYGTGNKGKLEQVQSFFKINDIHIEIVSLKDIGFDKEIIEDGKTFEENSLIKAKVIKTYCDEKGIEAIIITDDAGLCVDALDGRPGVLSARYAGDHAPQDITLKKLLDEMKQYTNMEDRTAKFVCVLTASMPDNSFIVARGETRGKVAFNVNKYGGLTYEPIFIPDGFDKPLGDMNIEEFAKVKNHRDLAMVEIFNKLK
jgi:XTP/dITP diphosphohydrolase